MRVLLSVQFSLLLRREKMEFIVSEKRKELIVLDGFKFRFEKVLANEIQRWSCCKKCCKAFFKLNSLKEIVERKLDHNHDADNKKFLIGKKLAMQQRKKQ